MSGMGQTMAECDCPTPALCERAGKCVSDKPPQPPLSVRVSRWLNAATGGTPGVTLSAESERRRRAGRWLGYALVWIINTWTRDPDHCAKAWRLETERGRWNV